MLVYLRPETMLLETVKENLRRYREPSLSANAKPFESGAKGIGKNKSGRSGVTMINSWNFTSGSSVSKNKKAQHNWVIEHELKGNMLFFSKLLTIKLEPNGLYYLRLHWDRHFQGVAPSTSSSSRRPVDSLHIDIISSLNSQCKQIIHKVIEAPCPSRVVPWARFVGRAK